MKRHKFGAQKTNGYDSKKEYQRSEQLKFMERINQISDLREQVVFGLLPAQYVTDVKGKQICGRREMRYIADFVYVRNGETIIEDTKGYKTAEYKRKKRLMEKIHGIKIKES